MAPTVIRKFFENLKGLNDSFTDLTRPPDYMSQAQNIIWLPNGNLEKRKGGKIITQFAGKSKGSSGKFRMPLAVMPYSYTDETSLSDFSELCVLSVDTSAIIQEFMFERVATGTLSLTYSGPAATVILTFFPNSSNVWELNITENGTPVSGFPKQYGTGLEDSPTALTTLISDIDALANYACSGSFTTDLPAAILPVVSSLDLSSGSGSISYSYLETIHDSGTSTTYYNPYGAIKFRAAGYTLPSFVTARDCLYFTGFDTQLHKFDGSRVYRAGRPVPTKAPIVSSSGASGIDAGTYTYYYSYVKRPKADRGGEIESALSDGAEITLASAKTVTVQIPSIRTYKVLGVTKATGAGTTIQVKELDFKSIITPHAISIFNAGSGSWTSASITSFSPNSSPATITINTSISTNDDTFIFQASEPYGADFFEDAISSSGSVQSNVTTITCTNNTTSMPLVFRVGDWVMFYDSISSTYVERQVTASTTTSITISGSAVTVGATTTIVASVKIRIYRTKNAGFEKFLIGEIGDVPTDSNILSPLESFTDNTKDEAALVQYLPPVNTPDPPPLCRFVTTHQNLLVVAGDFTNPKTVSFSEPDNIESFPLATNSFAPSFSSSGEITGLASDEGVLVVFGQEERAVVQGELSSLDFRVDVISDGIGCVSHNSIAKVEEGVIWLSKRGFERSIAGQLDRDFYLPLWARFRNQFYLQTDETAITTAQESKFVMQRAIATYDAVNNLYVCFIPAETGTPSTSTTTLSISATKYANSNSKWFVYDTEQEAWAIFSLPEKMNAAGGLAMFNNELYWGSAYKVDNSSPPDVAGHVIKRHSNGTIYDYADGADAISAIAATSWDSLGEQDLLKKVLSLKVWQMMSDAIFPFSVTIELLYDWSDSNAHTSASKTFSASTEIEKDIKAKAGKKIRSLKFRVSNSTLHQGLSITGLQTEIAGAYRGEVKT